MLQRRFAHSEAGKPTAGSVGKGTAHYFEAGTLEEGLSTEEDVVVAGAPAAGAGVGFDCGCAVVKCVFGRSTDEFHGYTLTARFFAHCHAWDNPNVLIVDAWSGPRFLNPGEFIPGCDGNPAYGPFFAEGEEAGGDGASGEAFHCDATALSAGPFSRQLVPLRARDAGEHTPTAATPTSAQHDPHALHQVGGEGADGEARRLSHWVTRKPQAALIIACDAVHIAEN